MHLLTLKQELSYSTIVGHGELLLFSVVLSASSIGDLVIESRYTNVRMINAGVSLMILALCSFWFADINARITNNDLNVIAISWGSTFLFACAVIVSGCTLCVKGVNS